jgi:protein-S-isoprenylcysteine O-methyltransferase Ste14
MTADRTGIVIPPPLLFAAPFLCGWLIGRRSPWTLFEEGATAVVLGAVFTACGAAVAIAGVRQFRAARTTVLPFGGTSRIVITGIYRWSRNPMYLGMAVAYVGFSILANSGWCLMLLPVALVLVYLLAIRPEERYLRGKFGASYEQYRAHVPRWI